MFVINCKCSQAPVALSHLLTQKHTHTLRHTQTRTLLHWWPPHPLSATERSTHGPEFYTASMWFSLILAHKRYIPTLFVLSNLPFHPFFIRALLPPVCVCNHRSLNPVSTKSSLISCMRERWTLIHICPYKCLPLRFYIDCLQEQSPTGVNVFCLLVLFHTV